MVLVVEVGGACLEVEVVLEGEGLEVEEAWLVALCC